MKRGKAELQLWSMEDHDRLTTSFRGLTMVARDEQNTAGRVRVQTSDYHPLLLVRCQISEFSLEEWSNTIWPIDQHVTTFSQDVLNFGLRDSGSSDHEWS